MGLALRGPRVRDSGRQLERPGAGVCLGGPTTGERSGGQGANPQGRWAKPGGRTVLAGGEQLGKQATKVSVAAPGSPDTRGLCVDGENSSNPLSSCLFGIFILGENSGLPARWRGARVGD